MGFCMQGGIREAVLISEFCQHWLRGFGAVRGWKSPFAIAVAMGLQNSYHTSHDTPAWTAQLKHNLTFGKQSMNYQFHPLTPTIFSHIGTAIKHPVSGHVKPSFVIFDIRALWQVSECPDVKNYKWRLNSVWHGMLYSGTHYCNSGRHRVNGWYKNTYAFTSGDLQSSQGHNEWLGKLSRYLTDDTAIEQNGEPAAWRHQQQTVVVVWNHTQATEQSRDRRCVDDSVDDLW